MFNLKLKCMNKLIVLLVCMVSSFAVMAQDCDKKMARVYRHNGLLIFTDCEPVSDYEVVDHVKSAISWDGQYSGIKDKLVRKALSDNPTADGIILSMTSAAADKAVVIRFKEGADKQKATVRRSNGVLVYTDCEPECDYEVVARSKVSFALNGQYDSLRDKLIKKILKKNPYIDGVILTFSSGSSDRVVGIRFKK